MNQLQFPDEVLYTLFYHDYIYSRIKKDNELKSAKIAGNYFRKIQPYINKLFSNMILATNEHKCIGV